MVFTKYSKTQREKDEILFNVKQSAPSPYKWQQKTFAERLSLVLQYLLAYNLMLDLYILQYVVVKPYGILYILITCFGLYGDGTTYTQLFCLLFAFWAVLTSIWLRLFLGNPKRLQWFYDIVGEERVKPILFQSPFTDKLITFTAPTFLGLVGLNAGIEQYHESKHQEAKTAAKTENLQNWETTKSKADDRLVRRVEITPDRQGRRKAYLDHSNELGTANKVYEKTEEAINNITRTTNSFPVEMMRSDQTKHIADTIERGTSNVFGGRWWGWGKKDD